MFLWDEQPNQSNPNKKEFYRLGCDKIDEHEDELMSVDYLPMKSDNHDSQKLGGLFVTGGKDGLVKVWNIKKELIREIKFPEPITAVCFLNSSADLLVGHIGKVSSVSTVFAKDYKPYEQMELACPSE